MIEYATLDGTVLQDLSINSDTLVVGAPGITGLPPIRGEAYDRPDADGAVEPANQYFGPRVSVWEIVVCGDTLPDARQNWTALSRFLASAMRQQKQLRWRMVDDTLELQSNVRVAGMTPPVIDNSTTMPALRFSVMFRHADPANYSQSSEVEATGAPSVTVTGITWPVVWPIDWSLIPSGSGTVSVTNAGDAYAWPLIEISGPINNPVIQNQTTNKSLYFDGLSLGAGEVLSIDMNPANQAASVGGISKFANIRFSASEFFPISPGAVEQISFTGSGTDSNTTMTVSLRSAYYT